MVHYIPYVSYMHDYYEHYVTVLKGSQHRMRADSIFRVHRRLEFMQK